MLYISWDTSTISICWFYRLRYWTDIGNKRVTKISIEKFKVTTNFFSYVFYHMIKYEMRISDKRWCTRAVYAIKIWHAPFCYVIKKCQMHTSDKLEKCVHSVVLLCSNVEIYTKQKTFAVSINFLISFEENSCWIIPITSRDYGEYAPPQNTRERWFRRFKIGDFSLTEKEHGKPPKYL